jgi:hypothetical protein
MSPTLAADARHGQWGSCLVRPQGPTNCIYLAQVHERTSNSEDVTQLPATNRRFRPYSIYSIPPGSVNFLGAAVQLAQQQQQEAFAAVRVGGIAIRFGVGWAGLAWGGIMAQGLFQKSNQLIAAQVRPAAQLLLPADFF